MVRPAPGQSQLFSRLPAQDPALQESGGFRAGGRGTAQSRHRLRRAIVRRLPSVHLWQRAMTLSCRFEAAKTLPASRPTRFVRARSIGPEKETQTMPLSRRAFSATLIGAAASLSAGTRAAPAAPVKAQNVVLVHGLFADGSCWSDVIGRLQAAGLNVTAGQNPLTTPPHPLGALERRLARRDGPAGLVRPSLAGMIAPPT